METSWSAWSNVGEYFLCVVEIDSARFLDDSVIGRRPSVILTSRVSKKTVDVWFLLLHDQNKVEGRM